MAQFQEIKVKKKSLRDILPPKHGGVTLPPPPTDTMRMPSEYRLQPERHWGWPVWTILVLVLVVATGYLATKALARVTVELSLTPIDIVLDETIALSRNGSSLGFNVITLPSQTGTREVKASGTEQVNRPASGSIIIYNNYGKDPERLIANTRFQAKNGKIYRIREAVTVPGTRVVEGKVMPGTLEAVVYADVPGAEGNGEATDFTIPGLEGNPRYDQIYARSKTALTGGATGEIRKLLPADEQAARVALRAEVTAAMLKEARAKIPASFILFDNLTKVDIRDVSDFSASVTGDNVMVRETLALQGLMLPRQSLVEKLIGDKVQGFAANELLISNLDELEVAFVSPPTGDLAETEEFAIRIRGSARLLPRIDVVLLTDQLAGIRKDQANEWLNQIKGLESARVIFRPSWLSQVPLNPSRIKVQLLPV